MQNIEQKRAMRIQQIKDCGQTIIDHAEGIYGEYACPTSLKVTINMDVNSVPTITVERAFYPDKIRDHP